ncbi:hypothetical protein Tco_1312225 [Tanacetum coccineum]
MSTLVRVNQVLWIQNQMLDYGFNFMNTKIYIDNESTICIVKNPVFHSKTKHIKIRHLFIIDSYEKKLIQVIKIHTDHNVVDLLTKAFDVSRTNHCFSSSQLKKTHKPRKAKRTTKISQSSRPIHLVTDETIYKEWEDRMERAATTASSLEANQDNDNGEVQITATIDGKAKLVSEASIRRHLKLEDSYGINTLPNTEIFEQLALMGFIQIFLNKNKRLLLPYNKTYIAPTLAQKLFSNMRSTSKGYTGVDIPLFPTMLVQGAPTTSQLPLSSPSRIPTRQETEVPQPCSPTHTNVADKAASIGMDVRHGGVATTISSLDAVQGSGNINKTSSMPHDLPLLKVHILGSDEGRI